LLGRDVACDGQDSTHELTTSWCWRQVATLATWGDTLLLQPQHVILLIKVRQLLHFLKTH